MQVTFIRIAELAYAAGFRGDDHAIAIAVTVPESGRRSDAVNTANTDGSVDTGLWQINSIHGYDPDKLLDPAFNARCAYEIWQRQGWGAWVAYDKRLHEPSLDAAKVAMDARARLAAQAATIQRLETALESERTAAAALTAAHAELKSAVRGDLELVIGKLT